MKSILQMYISYCAASYSSLGFKRHKSTYARVINDVLQTFTFKRFCSGHECTVEFGIFPLCIGLSSPDIGVYDLRKFNVSSWFEGTLGWRYEKQSQESTNICLSKIISVIDHDLIPLFNRADCSEKALRELIAVDRLFERKRLEILKLDGRENSASDIEYRILMATEKLYFALKIKDYEYADRVLEAHLYAARKKYNEELMWHTVAKTEGQLHDKTQRIEKYKTRIRSIEAMRKRVADRDDAYFEQMIQENEAFSKTHLAKFYVTT